MSVVDSLLKAGAENRKTLISISESLQAAERRDKKETARALKREKTERQNKLRELAAKKKETSLKDIAGILKGLNKEKKGGMNLLKWLGLGALLTLGPAVMNLVNTFLAVKNVFDTVWKAFVNEVKFAGKKIGEFADAIGNEFEYAGKKINEFGDKVGNEFEWITGELKKNIQEFPKLFVDSQKAIVEGFAKFFRELPRNINNILAGGGHLVGNKFNEIKSFFGFQTGGPITVPGSGSGDKVPMMLPSGSFVLNRNASNYLRRQNGGVVPTMLEPGELVYLNENISRFQQGGAVKDSKPPAKDMSSKISAGKSGLKMKMDDIAPGGTASFIGDGSGFMGTLTIKDGNGKTVGQWLASSGVARTAGATQEQRRNVSGTLNPLPDGTYPMDKLVYHEGQKVGDWSAYVNGPGGNIGKRGEILLHNDIGSNGTAGCIGVELGGTRGSAASMQFAKAYEKAGVKSIVVKLTENGGPAPGSPKVEGDGSKGGKGGTGGGGGGGGGIGGGLGQGLAAAAKQFGLGELASAFTSELARMGGSFFNMMSGTGAANAGTGGGGGGFDVSGNSDPLTGDVAAKAKAMYDYIKSKGYSDAQAKGIVANIHRESTFNAKARSGDDGGPGGLFQWKGSRQTKQVAGLVDSGNWKGQIDYALQEDVGPQYKSATSNMNAHEASMWWAKHWERPASLSNANNKHAQFLKSYKFQKGGMVPTMLEPGEMVFGPGQWNSSIKSLNSAIPRFRSGGTVSGADNAYNSMLREADSKLLNLESLAANPIVVPMSQPQAGAVATTGGNPPPQMPSGPSVNFLHDVINRTNMGSVFS